MKIKMKDALDAHNILSHVFLECTPRKILEEIAEEKMKLSKEEQDDYTIQLDVLINGHKVNPEKFFKLMEDQYEGHVRREATNIVKTQLGDKFSYIINKLQDAEQVVDDWTGEINWDVPNPFVVSPTQVQKCMKELKSTLGALIVEQYKWKIEDLLSKYMRAK
jgi:hypothetical protein